MTEYASSLVQLLGWIGVVAFLLLFCFSRFNPIEQGIGLVMIVAWVTLTQLLWQSWLSVTIWYGNEDIFDWGFTPLLPALIVYMGLVSVIVVVSLSWSVLSSSRHYGVRQRVMFVCSSCLVIVGVYQTIRLPFKLQEWVDHLPSFPAP